MRRGDEVEIRRYERPGKPAAGDVPTVLRGRVLKAMSSRVWVDVGLPDAVVAWRHQVRPISEPQGET